MGANESSVIEPSDVVGEREPESTETSVTVQYGPNIVGQLLGYDQRTEELSHAAHTLFEAVSRPSNDNKQKAQILMSDVHSAAVEQGRATVSLAEIERDLMDDVEYKAFLHKKTYGVRSMEDVDKKFNLEDMDSVCLEYKQQIEDCLQQKENNASSTPYYNASFSSLNCTKQMDLYNNCISRRLSALY
eukprot:CAMPEP_0202690206 /NCGR_PEP_ID=MMETSP1385-20130828/5267_1 /ASSEMBLY_ACC=CAM_ASM_000861 /TAXON_ID=933848 /ORGANISM="Elphidium margaritaceum" /LENGTH=187 /DNA_ID=CAMNT_0049345441 /DNA_START=44 /DNA_END=607 /DNA_ORIENTATION=-